MSEKKSGVPASAGKKSKNKTKAKRASPKRKQKASPAKEKASAVLAAVKDRIRMKTGQAGWRGILTQSIPYIIVFYLVDKEAWLYRHCTGDSLFDRLMVLFMNFSLAFRSYLPSVHPFDVAVGAAGAAIFYGIIYYRRKNAKKYRQGEEYGSARWGTAKDIAPFVDPVFENNIILTQTEFLTMNSRPKDWRYARNKNIIVIGGSGSGKTRYFVKPNLMQMPEKVSYVVTDPKTNDF